MEKLRIVFMGTPEFGVNALCALDEKYDVVAVVCQPDKPSNRGVIKYCSIKEYALSHNIKVYQPVKIKEDYHDILNEKPDLIVTCAYGQILPSEVFTYPKYGCINIHASLLPKLRGGAPIHRAIINGDDKAGVTIMKTVSKMDAGDMLISDSIDILDEFDTGVLHDKLSLMGKDLILKAIDLILSGNAVYTKQDEKDATFGFAITKEDEHILFNKPSRCVFNQIRGLSPFPGGYAMLNDKRVKIYKSRIVKSNSNKDIGMITKLYDDGFGVKTSDGEVIITELQLEGKKKMSAKDFINGMKDIDLFLNSSLK